MIFEKCLCNTNHDKSKITYHVPESTSDLDYTLLWLKENQNYNLIYFICKLKQEGKTLLHNKFQRENDYFFNKGENVQVQILILQKDMKGKI